MILRKSKEKAFVDASYNRYAWNDPANLPEWFVDDENKHHRPQLPIPPALLAKMKEKMMALSTKPIAKVAEARARKNKRAKLKLDAAKKKAEALANSSDMSESMKLKAISKALRVQEAKKPGKKYVVAKKGRNNMGVKGAKLVDGRLKNDKRSASRTEKKRKRGKQGGLVGSKKRRHHK
jgi:AdoMet-dependent rRNA methyltransferase SPB1